METFPESISAADTQTPAVLVSGDIEETSDGVMTLALFAVDETPSAGDLSMAPTAEDALSAEELFSRGQNHYSSRNYDSAAKYFYLAAEKGSSEGQYMYALMLYRGEGVAKADANEAARYYALAAEKGFSKAQYNLAVLFYEGEGVARSDENAYKWLYLAAAQNEPRALKMLPVAERNLTLAQKTSVLSNVAKASAEK